MTELTQPALVGYVARVRQIDERLDELEKEVNALKIERWSLTTRTIPQLMLDNMQRDTTLEDGTKVVVSDDVQGGFPKDDGKASDALRWLRENGHGDIIRNSVTALFVPGQDAQAKQVEEQLVKLGVTMERRQVVNHQTYLSWARKRLKEGEIIDLESLGLSQVTVAKIKFKKGDDHG